MKFDNIEHLNDLFKRGKFKMDSNIDVNGIKYSFLSSSHYRWHDMLTNKPGIMVYSAGRTHKSEAKEKGLDEWLAFMWTADNHNKMVPAQVKPTSSARMAFHVSENTEPNIIGDTIRLRITSLPHSTELKGKVDTGATISSLHAEKWTIERDVIKFTSPPLSSNVITARLVDRQAVKSADGGTEYRPVVEFNIKINDKQFQNMQFNLNDRSSMEYPVLIGQNILERGKFLIDPTIEEHTQCDIDWEELCSNMGDVVVETQSKVIDNTQIEQIYNTLSHSDITFNDLIKLIRTKVTESINDIND